MLSHQISSLQVKPFGHIGRGIRKDLEDAGASHLSALSLVWRLMSRIKDTAKGITGSIHDTARNIARQQYSSNRTTRDTLRLITTDWLTVYWRLTNYWSVRGQESSTCALLIAVPPVVINFHPLPPCHEVTFPLPSRDNRNQVVYNSIKLGPTSCDHVIVIDRDTQCPWLSIFGSKRNQASCHARRRKSSGTKDTIKDIIAASIVTYILSFSCCHYVTAEAFPSTSV